MPDLHELRDKALIDTIRDLLHERGDAVALIDRRADELPFHPLLEAYEQGTEAVRDKIHRASIRLLRESGATPWPVERLQFLLAFVERARLREAAETLDVLLSPWSRQTEGEQRRILALRTLLGVGWLGTLSFWEEQIPKLETQAPDLLFRGFRHHGLRAAFNVLPRLVSNRKTIRKILAQFPAMIEKYGSETLSAHATKALADLADEPADELQRWLGGLERVPKPTPSERGTVEGFEPKINVIDETALVDDLGKRKFAYPIRKFGEGKYVFMYVTSDISVPPWPDIERLRRLVVRTDDDLKRALLKGKVKPQAPGITFDQSVGQDDKDTSATGREAKHDSDAELAVTGALVQIPDLLKPGEHPMFLGKYEERGPKGGRVAQPKEIVVESAGNPLPPTQKEGRTWKWIA